MAISILLGLLSSACGSGGGSVPDARVSGYDAREPDAAPPDAKEYAKCEYVGMPQPPAPLYTPRWAFEPWISKDISDDADTRAFIDGFASRNIPVGVLVVDSPWETNYNTYIVNENRYPNFQQLVDDLHGDDIRVIMWMTNTVNVLSFDLEDGGDSYPDESPNYAEGEENGYFVNDAGLFGWWKGMGSGIDFCSKDAMDWWHQQQNAILDMGIDGWKVDFAEEWMEHTPVGTAVGEVTHQDYSESFYRDALAYGVHRNGTEFVTMVRPYDKSYSFDGRFFARPEHAPVAWVGDNHRNWQGLADALDHLFRSSLAGYVVIGSDIGGYLDAQETNQQIKIPFDQHNFARWTPIGSLSPFMQLHGRSNISPWQVPENVDETVELYRYWSWLHHQMVPFFYSLAQEAYRHGGGVIMRPVETDESKWPGDFRYHLGDVFLVAPILEETAVRDVELPAGAAYYDWWNPGADAIAGGTTIEGYDVSADQRKIPVFVRAGAILPAEVSEAETELGNAASDGHLTVAVWPAATPSSFVLWEADDTTTEVAAVLSGAAATVTLARAVRPTILRVRADSATSSVTLNGNALTEHSTRVELDAATSGWFYDSAVRATWVKIGAADSTRTVVLTSS